MNESIGTIDTAGSLWLLPQNTKPQWDFGSAERQIAELAVNDALDILGTNLDCQDFFNAGLLSGGDAAAVLRKIKAQGIGGKGGIVRGNPNASYAPTAETLPAAGGKSRIHLYNSFFSNTVGGATNEFGRNSLSQAQARALVILHELAHAVWRNFHPFFMSSRELDRNIFEKCFRGGQTPLPRGIA